MTEEKPKARKQSMLYEVCSLCNGTGVGPFGNGKCACKRLFVVETGATARQLEAVVEENGKLKARIAELEAKLQLEQRVNQNPRAGALIDFDLQLREYEG